MVYTTHEAFPQGKVCCFCKTNKVDPINMGNIHGLKNIILHYYCLLLASKVEQKGSDRQGILGFILEDIKKEVERGKSIKCCYCKKSGATIHCGKNKCKAIFHLSCGLEHNSMHFFFQDFKSVCGNHRVIQSIAVKQKKEILENNECLCCYSPVDIRNAADYIWPTCCKPSSILHRKCVQQMALNSGYYFKCLLCNNTETFCKAMKDWGIYIPEQDSAWEREPNAYQDLLDRNVECTATPCSCPRGTRYKKKSSRWHLEFCELCGQCGIHLACAGLWDKNKKSKISWSCAICSGAENSSNPPDEAHQPHEAQQPHVSPEKITVEPQERIPDNVEDLNMEVVEEEPTEFTNDFSHMFDTPPSSKSVSPEVSYVRERSFQQPEVIVIDDSDDEHDDANVISLRPAAATAPIPLISPVSPTGRKRQGGQSPPPQEGKRPRLSKNDRPVMGEIYNSMPAVTVYSLAPLLDARSEQQNQFLNTDSRNVQLVGLTVPHYNSFYNPQVGNHNIIKKEKLSLSDTLKDIPFCNQNLLKNMVDNSVTELMEDLLKTVSDTLKKGETITSEKSDSDGLLTNSNSMTDAKSPVSYSSVNSVDSKLTTECDKIVFNQSLSFSKLHTKCDKIVHSTLSEVYLSNKNNEEHSSNPVKIGSKVQSCAEIQDKDFNSRFTIEEHKENVYHNQTSNNNFSNANKKSLHIMTRFNAKQKRQQCSRLQDPNITVICKKIKIPWQPFRKKPLLDGYISYSLSNNNKIKLTNIISSFVEGDRCFVVCDDGGVKYCNLLQKCLPPWNSWIMMYEPNATFDNVFSQVKNSFIGLNSRFTLVIILVDEHIAAVQDIDNLASNIKNFIGSLPILNLVLCTIPSTNSMLSFTVRRINIFNQQLKYMTNRLGIHCWNIKNIIFENHEIY